jgi:hypothetical protein
MDARKILAKLKGEADRVRTSLYLSRSIMEEFKDACGGMTPSRVMEELMLNFIEQMKGKKGEIPPAVNDKGFELEKIKKERENRP